MRSRPPLPAVAAAQRRPAFTLVEMLVVVGIVAVLVALALVGISKAVNTAHVTRMRADIQTISTALEAYRADCTDYPRFASASDDAAATQAGTAGGNAWLDYASDRGARLLCRALLGPAPAATVTGGSQPTLGNPDVGDGADGPGFRTRRAFSTETGQQAGKVYGPYLQTGKFKVQSDATGMYPNQSDAKLLDINDCPILYFPARPGPPHVSSTATGSGSAYVGLIQYTQGDTNGPSAALGSPLYNAADNTLDTTPQQTGNPLPYTGYPSLLGNGQQQMRYLLGDTNMNGIIDAGETAATTLPYLLWCAGPDRKFGFGTDPYGNPLTPAAGMKCDDVCNFDLPASVR